MFGTYSSPTDGKSDKPCWNFLSIDKPPYIVVGIIELATVLLACLSSSYFFRACLWWWDMASLFHNSINTPTYMGHWKNRSTLYVCSLQGLEFMLIDWKTWLCFPNLCRKLYSFFSQFSLKRNWIFQALVNLWLYLFWTEGMAILFLSNYFMWLQFEQSVDVTIIKSDIGVIFSNELPESFCFCILYMERSRKFQCST